jgi:hypothetical protein
MSKHKYIQTPELMWQYFQTYAHEVKSNPRIKTVHAFAVVYAKTKSKVVWLASTIQASRNA